MISIAELDTDKLKQSFITYLQTQPIFKDYVYTGANINVLLDLLSKNDNLNAFLLNMVANEAFLDTAQLRDAVVSKAKELNYTPRSWRSPEGLLDLTVTTVAQPATTVTIAAGTSFQSRVDDQVYNFSTAESVSVIPTTYIPATNSYVYSFPSVSVFEGQTITETFAVDNSIEAQRFIMSNLQIDTQSIAVSVAASNTASTSVAYSAADTLLGVTENSTIYFVQATDGGQYELVFGDGILGMKPKTGNIITVSYRVTAGDAANGAANFTLTSPNLGGYPNYTISTADVARGGSVEESIESIRYNAPRHYQVRESAIAYPDYTSLIRENFPEVRALHIYGGEDVTPPRFGYVLISVDLQNFDGIPTVKKTAIESFIQPKMPPMIKPEVIEPDFTYIEVDADVEYSLALTTKSSDDIKTLITDAISAYSAASLENFDCTFRYAVLGDIINKADASISSTDVKIYLYKNVQPILNETFTQTLKFQNALEPGTVYSSNFVYNDIVAHLYDKGDGSLYIATPVSLVQLASPVGSIDYANGIVIISGLNVSAFDGESVIVKGMTQKQDVRAQQNTILGVGINQSVINALPVLS